LILQPQEQNVTSQQTPFLTRIQKHLERIEEEIEKNLHSSVPLVALVSRYIIRSGGKRLRPLLMVLASQLLDPEQDEHYPLSIIFEYLHAATLLHDDVVDHAELRRGKAAANTVFGNAAVVLVGDFLLATSFALSVTSGNLKILQVLSDTTKMMAEGEILQLINSDNLEASEQDYREVITRKTAILIAAACQIGAILGRADLRQEESMHSFGLNLGIAFQLRDDVLDYAGSEEEVGKPIGNDLREGKITLPLIRALSRSNNNERQRLVELITADEIDDNVFLEVRRIIDRHQGIEYTSRMAAQHIAMAKDALLSFPSSPTRDLLEEIADYVVSRRV